MHIILNKIGDHSVMGPDGGRADTSRVAIPIQIIGPMEEASDCTIVYMSAGFGKIKVVEKLDIIRDMINDVIANNSAK